MKMSVGVLDHYNVSTKKLAETVLFYESVLGFHQRAPSSVQLPGRVALQLRPFRPAPQRHLTIRQAAAHRFWGNSQGDDGAGLGGLHERVAPSITTVKHNPRPMN